MSIAHPDLPAVAEYPTEGQPETLAKAHALFVEELASTEGWEDQGEREGVQLYKKPDTEVSLSLLILRGVKADSCPAEPMYVGNDDEGSCCLTVYFVHRWCTDREGRVPGGELYLRCRELDSKSPRGRVAHPHLAAVPRRDPASGYAHPLGPSVLSRNLSG